MGQKIVKLNEAQVKKIVAESLNQILNEEDALNDASEWVALMKSVKRFYDEESGPQLDFRRTHAKLGAALNELFNKIKQTIGAV